MPASRHPVHELTIPAAATFIATARIFAGAVAAVARLDQDVVDDLKLAVSEVVTAIVERGETREVAVSTLIEPARLVVRIGPWSGEDPGEFGALDIVDALFPGAAAGDGVIAFAASTGA
jgi:anti-sigma regulatory factor (Ser/Thr protein kinase)